jgi:hypothetical protein
MTPDEIRAQAQLDAQTGISSYFYVTMEKLSPDEQVLYRQYYDMAAEEVIERWRAATQAEIKRRGLSPQ